MANHTKGQMHWMEKARLGINKIVLRFLQENVNRGYEGPIRVLVLSATFLRSNMEQGCWVRMTAQTFRDGKWEELWDAGAFGNGGAGIFMDVSPQNLEKRMADAQRMVKASYSAQEEVTFFTGKSKDFREDTQGLTGLQSF
jgi:hypothetical protein